MAVVTKYGRSRKDPNSIFLAEAIHAEGMSVDIASGPVAIANGDSAASKIYLGKVPSSGVIKPSSTVFHTAITGLASFSIGFEKDGNVNVTFAGGSAVAVLAAALDLTAAGSKNGIAAVTTPDLGKQVWELLGYPRDPGFEYDIVGTMNAAATAAGTVSAFFQYTRK